MKIYFSYYKVGGANKRFDLYEWKEDVDYDIKPSIYIVKKKDSIKKISKKFNITEEELMNLNDNIELYPGKIIFIEKQKNHL